MHRRTLLTLAGGVTLLGMPAFAQQRSAQDGQMGDAEIKHMEDTMRIGSLALATSRIAQQKAQNDMVKQFAAFEVAEQETIAEVLNSMRGAATTGSGGKAAEPKLDEKGQQILQKLQSAKSGREFDQEYVKAQTDGHQQLLQIQEAYLKAGKMREHVNVAKLARGQIKEHLVLLDKIDLKNKR